MHARFCQCRLGGSSLAARDRYVGNDYDGIKLTIFFRFCHSPARPFEHIVDVLHPFWIGQISYENDLKFVTTEPYSTTRSRGATSCHPNCVV
jgi:hypothetical protein